MEQHALLRVLRLLAAGSAAAVLALGLAACASAPSGTQGGQDSPAAAVEPAHHGAHQELTQELVTHVEKNAELRALLEASIAQAKAVNPDENTNPAQTLEEFYSYLDWACTAYPWALAQSTQQGYSPLYDDLDQALAYLYFISGQPLEQLEGSGLAGNSIQFVEPYRSWLKAFTEQFGSFLDTSASWSTEVYQLVKADPSYNLDGRLYEEPSNWLTFNQFFARRLSSPSVRPVSGNDDSSVVVSPADSQPQGVWSIGKKGLIASEDGASGLAVESSAFASVQQLLGSSAYAGSFGGGTLTHTRLDVSDYHRLHFPVSGIVREVLTIPADIQAAGAVTWSEEAGAYRYEPAEGSSQGLETRGLVVIETADCGLVAVMPVGTLQESSVVFDEAVKVGARVQKGSDLGCFLYGGGDVVMLFQSKVDFSVTAPKKFDGTFEHVNMGEVYGVLRKQK
ncbi:MAG: phosphatidylserine decarboxylase [Coriobacteriales bacterium]